MGLLVLGLIAVLWKAASFDKLCFLWGTLYLFERWCCSSFITVWWQFSWWVVTLWMWAVLPTFQRYIMPFVCAWKYNRGGGSECWRPLQVSRDSGPGTLWKEPDPPPPSSYCLETWQPYRWRGSLYFWNLRPKSTWCNHPRTELPSAVHHRESIN